MIYLQKHTFPYMRQQGLYTWPGKDDRTVLLLNCRGISFGHLTNSYTVKFLGGINTAGCTLFPMFLDKFYCTSVPGIAKALFACVKPLLDPYVASKNVLLTEKEVQKAMEELSSAETRPVLFG